MGDRSTAAATKPVGRPRRLSIDQVLEAAIALGLDRVTMADVARSLGVRVTVLYNYVANRDEMVRFAAVRVAQKHGFPADSGQHWSLYAAEHARALFALFTGPEQIISRYLAGGMGPELELDRAEFWLQAMTARGFNATEALRLLDQTGGIVIGGATTAVHQQRLAESGTSYTSAAAKALASRNDIEVPILKQISAEFINREQAWPVTLAQLFTAVAAERGERLEVGAVLALLKS